MMGVNPEAGSLCHNALRSAERSLEMLPGGSSARLQRSRNGVSVASGFQPERMGIHYTCLKFPFRGSPPTRKSSELISGSVVLINPPQSD
jgi:hypothetical protein